ncbi:MAG TPA: DNA gyrase inhibitor YacG [Gemmataceae bacterium]|nr:DNA gyrase inhibitor YacG [Gemmataceae bacterium]
MIKVRCPICQRVMAGQSSREWPQFPFCSPKCKLVDLGRWLGEAYSFPPEHDEEMEAPIETSDESP